MEDFNSLFTSRFQDNNRSLTNALAGLVDHAVRLRAKLPTGGVFKGPLLEACQATESMSERAQEVQRALGLGLGDQKQATSQTGTALTTALDRIRKNENTLKGDALIEDAAKRQRLYDLLYPTGTLAYYLKARLGTEMADRLGEYLQRTEDEQDTLGEAFVKRVQDDLSPFRQTRQDQVAAQTKTGDLRTDRRDLVAEIDELCDYDYHLLSAHFRHDLGRVANYWNPLYYVRAAPRAAPGGVSNLAIQAHQHRQLWDLATFPQLTQVQLSLRDGGPAQLARVDKATSPLPPTTLTLASGAPVQLALAAVPGTGTHLVAYNETGKVLHLDGQLLS